MPPLLAVTRKTFTALETTTLLEVEVPHSQPSKTLHQQRENHIYAPCLEHAALAAT